MKSKQDIYIDPVASKESKFGTAVGSVGRVTVLVRV